MKNKLYFLSILLLIISFNLVFLSGQEEGSAEPSGEQGIVVAEETANEPVDDANAVAVDASPAIEAVQDANVVAPASEDVAEPVLGNGKIMINFKDAQVSDVLDYLSATAGLIIISDVYLDTRISIISKQAITVDEAVELINSILKEKGYAAVRTGKTLKIVTIDQAKRSNIPVTSGNDPEKMTASDSMVTHIIPIRYAEATSLLDNLDLLIPDYAVLTANSASNSLIITDTKANIQRLIQIVKAVDTQMASVVDVRVFHLKYADAEDAADLINEVFEQQQGTSSRSSNPFAAMMGGRGGRGGRGEQQASSGDGSGSAVSNIKIIASADERTNAVVVSGPSETLDVIEIIVTELDSNPDEERTLFVYTLKNARADNIKDILNNLFSELQDINQQNTTGGRGQTNRGMTSAGGSSSSDLSDEVYIESDEDTNALLIMTSSKNYEKMKPVIAELDKPIPQVLIKVLIVEVTTTDSVDLGTEISYLNLRNNGNKESAESSLLPANLVGGLVGQIIQGDLSVTLHALQQVGTLNVLSRPYILTSNNQTATINIGQRVPFISDSTISDSGQKNNTISYEDIGINLEVTPNINSDGLVIMDVTPEISTTTGETVAISEDIDAAVFANRSANSRVAVQNGQTIVIGGLMQDQETETISKVPFLGDIPLLGEAFKRTDSRKEKIELLIFLTPQVATGDLEMLKLSETERSKSELMNQIDENEVLKKHIENMESIYNK